MAIRRFVDLADGLENGLEIAFQPKTRESSQRGGDLFDRLLADRDFADDYLTRLSERLRRSAAA